MADTDRPRRPRREQRLDKIMSALSAEGSIDVTTLAVQLNVSAASIRRDLDLLEQQRLLRRTHGGAVAQGISYELPVRYRSGQQEEQKRAIAKLAATRVPEGRRTVGLTGGTTTTEVARCLLDHQDLTVVTNAINIASELVVRRNVRLVVTGGVARSQSYELVGPLAEASLSGLNLDVAFLGFDGASAQAGFTTHQEMEAHTDRALLTRARKVIAVGDSTKLGKVTFAQICQLNDVDELITDAKADPEVLAGLEAAGLRVSMVRPTDDVHT
jgi:DeoR family transcriptional regulator, aga operon transcriptional repressor